MIFRGFSTPAKVVILLACLALLIGIVVREQPDRVSFLAGPTFVEGGVAWAELSGGESEFLFTDGSETFVTGKVDASQVDADLSAVLSPFELAAIDRLSSRRGRELRRTLVIQRTSELALHQDGPEIRVAGPYVAWSTPTDLGPVWVEDLRSGALRRVNAIVQDFDVQRDGTVVVISGGPDFDLQELLVSRPGEPVRRTRLRRQEVVYWHMRAEGGALLMSRAAQGIGGALVMADLRGREDSPLFAFDRRRHDVGQLDFDGERATWATFEPDGRRLTIWRATSAGGWRAKPLVDRRLRGE